MIGVSRLLWGKKKFQRITTTGAHDSVKREYASYFAKHHVNWRGEQQVGFSLVPKISTKNNSSLPVHFHFCRLLCMLTIRTYSCASRFRKTCTNRVICYLKTKNIRPVIVTFWKWEQKTFLKPWCVKRHQFMDSNCKMAASTEFEFSGACVAFQVLYMIVHYW